MFTYEPITKHRKRRRKLSEQQEKDLATAFLAGTTGPELCETYDISRTSLARVLRRAHVKRRRRQEPRIKEGDLHSLAFAYHEERLPVPVIAESYRCTAMVVYAALRRAGIGKRPTRKQLGLPPRAVWRVRQQEERKKPQPSLKQAAVQLAACAPMIGKPEGTTGSGRQRPRPVSLRGFPRLPGEEGYVYG